MYSIFFTVIMYCMWKRKITVINFSFDPFYSIMICVVNIKSLDEEKKISYIFFFTPLIIVAFIALFSRANANWAAVGFPFGCILLAQLFEERKYMSKKIYSLIS